MKLTRVFHSSAVCYEKIDASKMPIFSGGQLIFALIAASLFLLLNCQTPNSEELWQEYSHGLDENNVSGFFEGMMQRIDCTGAPKDLVCNKEKCLEKCEKDCEEFCALCSKRQNYLDDLYQLKCQELQVDCSKPFEMLYCCSAQTAECLLCVARAEKARLSFRDKCRRDTPKDTPKARE